MAATAFAAERAESTIVTTPLGQAELHEEGYSATLVVVSKSGAESIPVSRSDLTVNSVLESRGYDPASFKDDKGNPLELGQRLENDEQVVLYSSTVEGSSESIELKLPEQRIEDPELYEGQTIVEEPGVVGKALKTTIVHRDLSKVSQVSEVSPEKLDVSMLSSDSTATGEEIYITVLEAPKAKRFLVGTKPCGSDYLCDLLDEGGLAKLQLAGPYAHPLGESKGWTTYGPGISKSHDNGAVDFPTTEGSPIYAIADGVVEEAGWLGNGNGGNMAVIKHEDGALSGYAHMVEEALVEKGDTVKAGEIIGFVGTTGKSTGPHLHFEIWKDTIWGESIPAYEYLKLHEIEAGPCVSGPCELSKKS